MFLIQDIPLLAVIGPVGAGKVSVYKYKMKLELMILNLYILSPLYYTASWESCLHWKVM